MTDVGGRFVVIHFGDTLDREYGIEDLRDGSLLRHWHDHTKRTTIAGKPPSKGRIWRTPHRHEAEQLCSLMNKPAPAELGTVTLVGSTDPPTRENAKQWAIHRNHAHGRGSSRSKSTATLFARCPTCLLMVKKGHQCTPQ